MTFLQTGINSKLLPPTSPFYVNNKELSVVAFVFVLYLAVLRDHIVTLSRRTPCYCQVHFLVSSPVYTDFSIQILVSMCASSSRSLSIYEIWTKQIFDSHLESKGGNTWCPKFNFIFSPGRKHFKARQNGLVLRNSNKR